MTMQLELPPEFKEILEQSIEEVYHRAIEQARRDVGVIREYLSVKETCKILNITRNTLHTNYIEQGLQKYKIGNKIFIKKSELHEFINKHQVN